MVLYEMGKRYHCDFCDKSFAYSQQNRKKHEQGIQHQRNRKLHYDSFKDPAELLAEEANKQPCRRFFQTGTCNFGTNCRYSHTNPQLLLAQAEAAKQSNDKNEPSLEDWLSKWRKRRKRMEEKDKASLETEEENTLPAGLPHVSVLPPSLRPPPPGGYAYLSNVEWG